MASRKTSFMTEPAVAPDTRDVGETVGCVRRVAELMANGHKGVYLRRAADLLETLTVRVVSASDEEGLWRYKYETLTQHTGALQAECEALKNDIEGHLEIASSLLAERDTLGGTLQAREAELAVLREALNRERDERTAKSAAHEEALNGLRSAFDRINALRNQAMMPQAGAEAAVAARPGAGAEAFALPVLPNGQQAAGGVTSALGPITGLPPARAQVEYLARELIPLGDLAPQVMCELRGYTMHMALIRGRPHGPLPVRDGAPSLLAP